MTKETYNKKLLNARRYNIATIKQTEEQLLKVLNKAYNDIVNKLELTKKDTITYDYYNSKKKSIKRVIDSMTTGISNSIKSGIKTNTETITDLYARTSKEYAKDLGINNIDFDRAFNTVPQLATQNSINRLWGSENFSDRIFKMNKYAQDGIKLTVQSGIARGQSAVDMAKELKQFLVNPEVTKGTAWTTGAKKSKAGRGTINYNALRLARTEINNSYRETLIQGNARNPITKGVKWNLSDTHPFPDVCDLFAGIDSFGLGVGVYPAMATPIDHPNGLCFLTEELRSISEWKKPKPEYQRIKLSKAQILKKLSRKDLSESQIDGAYKMFNSSLDMVKRESEN